MMWPPVRFRTVAVTALAVVMAVPAYGEAPTSPKTGDGMTRDAFADPNTPPPAPAPAAPRPRSKRTRLDSKDFLSVHHSRRHRRHKQAQTQVASATSRPPTKRRNPVAGFVYWWNGFVIKTFHTKVGTVMLGTIGAKS